MSRKTEPRGYSPSVKGNCSSCGGRGVSGMYQDRCTSCDGTGLNQIERTNLTKNSLDDKTKVISKSPTKKDSIKKSKLAVIGSNPTIPQKELTEQIEEVLEDLPNAWCEDCEHPRCIGKKKSALSQLLDIVNQAVVSELKNLPRQEHHRSNIRIYTCTKTSMIRSRIKELEGKK